MTSLRGRLFYRSTKRFFGWVMPPDLSVETYRLLLKVPFFEPLPHSIHAHRRLIGAVPGEWIVPNGAASDRVLLYLHGGGYVLRTPKVHRVLVGRLARAAGISAFMVDYRLAPEHPFPAALDDAVLAYQGLIAEGFAPDRIVVAGDSAGGGLTAALLLRLNALEPASLPAAAGLISAVLDATLEGCAELQSGDPFLRLGDLTRMLACYTGFSNHRDPLISPLFASASELGALPPLLVYAAEGEILSDQAVRFADRARNAGADVTLRLWPEMVHAFPIFAGMIPEGRTAIANMGAFFRQQLRFSSI